MYLSSSNKREFRLEIDDFVTIPPQHRDPKLSVVVCVLQANRCLGLVCMTRGLLQSKVVISIVIITKESLVGSGVLNLLL